MPWSVDVNLVRAETKKSFAIYLPYMLDNFLQQQYKGAPLLGLAKSIYYSEHSSKLFSGTPSRD